MRAVAGEFGDEVKAAACFNGVPTRAVHVVLARSACSRRALSESASTDDLSQRYGQPYAQRGHVCVWCMVLCIILRVPQAVGSLDVLLVVMVGHFRARKKSILSTQTFLSLLNLLDHLPLQRV